MRNLYCEGVLHRKHVGGVQKFYILSRASCCKSSTKMYFSLLPQLTRYLHYPSPHILIRYSLRGTHQGYVQNLANLEETCTACNKWLQVTLSSGLAPSTNKFNLKINVREEINDGRNSTLGIHGGYDEYQDPRIKVAMINFIAYEDFRRRLIQRNIEKRKGKPE
jgi:hypothetical protein